jgi:hypothetical protein
VKRILQISGVVLLCVTTLLGDPATTAAMATVIGEVSLNGNALTRSCAVMVGDRLSTGASAALILHLAGSSVHVGPSSKILYHGNRLELLTGMSEVQGSETVIAGAFTISPVGEARFQVLRQGARTSLSIVRGSLRLARGKEVRTISEPGEYSLQDNQPVPAVKRHGISSKNAVAGGAAAGAATIIGHWVGGGSGTQAGGTSGSCVSGKSPSSCR